MAMYSSALSPVVIVALTILLARQTSGQEQRETRFSRENVTCGQLESVGLCPVQAGSHVVGHLRCGSQCAAEDECDGFFLDSEGRCFFLKDSCDQSSSLCQGAVEKTIIVFSRCKNFGQWQLAEQRCLCISGYVGARCERLARSCRELMEHGYPEKRQKVTIHPPAASQPMTIVCTVRSQNNQVYTFLALNNRRHFSFNRTWEEYVKGFQHSTSHSYWLGLDNMHTLYPSASASTLIFRFTMGEGNTTSFYFSYSRFSISDSVSSYTLRYNGTNQYGNRGNLTDTVSLRSCLSTEEGVQFSTPDSDNDLDSGAHCAKLAGTGWWFESCSPSLLCNPLGLRYRPSDDDIKPGYIQPNGDGWQDYKDTINFALYVRE